MAAAADEASGSVTASSTGGKEHVLGIVQPHKSWRCPMDLTRLASSSWCALPMACS